MNVVLIDPPTKSARVATLQRAWLAGDELQAVSAQPASAGGRRQLWWLWPHLLSLDAPLVALVWLHWWARGAGVTLPVSREIILGLGVWLIYLADRLIDAVDSRRMCGAPRHVFSARHRKFLLPLVAAVASALVCVVLFSLPEAEFRAGIGLLALAVGYFWLTHGWPGRGWAVYVPKEAVVGAMFSVGSGFFVVCRSPQPAGDFWFGIGTFAGVCFLNCALITHWERHTEDRSERTSLLNAFPRFSACLGFACILLAGLALAARSVLLLPVAASALLLAALDHHRNRVSVDALRVLADMVLLTPCLLFWR